VTDVREAITQAHHEEWARVVAALTKRFGDLDIAEEAAAEAFAGRRSSYSTTSSFASTPRRLLPSTGPSRSPSLTARRWH
jgi:predicted RNA polymerase sigma factor